MTDKTEAQPEALRLAGYLERVHVPQHPESNGIQKAATELRRQHAEIQQLKAQLSARQAALDGWRLVPVDFVRGFGNLVHNYSLQAIAPDYYWGNERSAFTDAYARCGHDLAELKALLSTAPPPPEREPLTDRQITAALMAWFGHDLVNNDQMYRDVMRDAINAAHGIGATNDNP